jgi:hypothetical protein
MRSADLQGHKESRSAVDSGERAGETAARFSGKGEWMGAAWVPRREISRALGRELAAG